MSSVRKTGFYARLAAQNIRKNGRFYLPYLLTGIGTSAMFYIMFFLMQNDGVSKMPGASTLSTLLLLGAVVIGIFSAVLLFYTNGFLMKQRKKELGLYNVLGMEKRHIARFMAWEAVYTALIVIIGGSAVGILLSKLVLLVLCAIMSFDVPFGFCVSWLGVALTAVCFAAIFFLNLLTNLWRIGRSKPIELLRGGNEGDREPKTRWVLTLIGAVSLIAGYWMAVTVKNPVTALGLFFVAVLLVILGTYCLFTAGSIAILKALRANKRYYYRANHFISVSGMLHRMKRNAAGLASICILSTMVLVTVSTTACLYFGQEDALKSQYPHEICLNFYSPGENTLETTVETVEKTAAEQNIKLKYLGYTRTLDLPLRYDGSGYTQDSATDIESDGITLTRFVTVDEYNRVTGNSVSLGSGEVLIESAKGSPVIPDTFSLFGMDFDVAGLVSDFEYLGGDYNYVPQALCVVVDSDETLNAISDAQTAKYKQFVMGAVYADIDGSGDEQSEFCSYVTERVSDTLYELNDESDTYGYGSFYGVCRAENSEEFYGLYGGFFFIGIFLGFLFLMATTLIIYYKQVSEGYEDAHSYLILQQVGMGQREVRSGIKSQILTVFILPIAAAAVHVAFAFPMITKMLGLFSISNTALFGRCTLGTVGIFFIVYGAVYLLTAKAYYRIVRVR